MAHPRHELAVFLQLKLLVIEPPIRLNMPKPNHGIRIAELEDKFDLILKKLNERQPPLAPVAAEALHDDLRNESRTSAHHDNGKPGRTTSIQENATTLPPQSDRVGGGREGAFPKNHLRLTHPETSQASKHRRAFPPPPPPPPLMYTGRFEGTGTHVFYGGRA